MNYVHYDKCYNTRTIRATLLMLITMMESNEIDYEWFYDYTGLARHSYIKVRKTIIEMIRDLNLKFTYEVVKYPRMNKHTRYFIYKYKINTPGIELKVTPYKKNKNGTLSAKERLVLNIINYMEEYKTTFYTSHFWYKNKLIEFCIFF